ncbi:DEAD/DEAH box helicase family protein [Corallococcus exercitus]|uniref:DEAD/DEAH box helicase family protein n=1 Tax=Corallococcus exercitus TaxID=2316736 RepID=A0A7Y4NRQ6_9BACT|nr:helicase-related protein [Corallococcus exercitus]NOK33187.1 DEAD/DEAH box helicase family protein [Corallococcus exercitus]
MGELLPGTEVRARGLLWEVVTVEAAGDQQRHRLRCMEGALRGLEMDFLAPFERLEPNSRKLTPERPGRLNHFRLYHQAFLLEQELGPGALLNAQPGRLKLAPYQLVPVMRALRLPRPRLLLADGVGLGKTIEAGLVISELLARRRAHRILIVSPAGPLLRQWRQEMRERFGLRFRGLDAAAMQEIRYATEQGTNPFDHVALGLISIDFAKQEKVLKDLERSHFDLVVIDEAHHCARLGPVGDFEDSQRRKLSELLARQSDGLLLLSATPHDGFDSHFASLVELLDPSLCTGNGGLRGERWRAHVVRRLKGHLRDPKTNEELFPERKVLPIAVGPEEKKRTQYARLQRALLELVSPHLKSALKQRRYGDVLAFIALLKRSVSTVAACLETLKVVHDRFRELVERGGEAAEARKERLRTLRDYRRRLERYGVLSFEEEQDQALLEAEDMAAELLEREIVDLTAGTRVARRKLEREAEVREGLERLIGLAEAALGEDPKLDALVAQIVEIREAEPDANVLVYTEYADSQRAVGVALEVAKKRKKLAGEVLLLSGADPDDQRAAITERFRTEGSLVLVSTDATSEGLNLHNHCHHLVHLELPYNPNRLEQRNGRIDRFGQKHTPVVRYLYLNATFEHRLLMRLIAKYERQRRALSFVPNTLGVLSSESDRLTGSLLAGLSEESEQLFAHSPEIRFGEEEEDLSSPAYRELLDEIDKAFSGFAKAAKTADWLGREGVGASQNLVDEAEAARNEAERAGLGGLDAFVQDALLLESGDPSVVKTSEKEVVTLSLPSTWAAGLEEVPGFDEDGRTLRLTTDAEQQVDGQGRPVGFIGRAHPIVRRALDRVRNSQFGSRDGSEDRRVSAAVADVPKPTLLLTYLGRVESAQGRELERLVAIRVGASELQALDDSREWLRWLDDKAAVSGKDVWKSRFEAWAPERLVAARDEAVDRFARLARVWEEGYREALDGERMELDGWLRTRAEELTGKVRATQTTLFEAPEESSGWRVEQDAATRLSGFATDASQPIKARREAEVVLGLHRKRCDQLERRSALSAPNVTELGMLMLLPKGEA